MSAILSIGKQFRFEPLQGSDAKSEHVLVFHAPQRFHHTFQSNSQRVHLYQVLVNDASEQIGCDLQFLLWVLWEKLVLVQQVADHTLENFLEKKTAMS